MKIGDKVIYQDRECEIYDILEPANADGYHEYFDGVVLTPPIFVIWEGGGTSVRVKDIRPMEAPNA